MTEPTDDIPWDQLVAFLAGELSADEAARLEAWIALDRTRGQAVEELRQVWIATGVHRPRWDVEAALREIKQRPRPIQDAPVVSLPRRRMGAMSRALIAAGVASLAVGAWWLTSKPSGRVALVSQPPAIVKEYLTKRGERLSLKLPDGTAVVLAPESRMRLTSTYGKPFRTVDLEGEGAFAVVHDETRPFAVRVGRAEVRDLGTRFVVRARDARPVEVVVAEGSVAFGSGPAPAADSIGVGRLSGDSLILVRGDLGRLSHTGGLDRLRSVRLDRYFGWMEGRLMFTAARLDAVVAELERWYDVEIRLTGSSSARRLLTASFRDEPVTEVLDRIATSLGLTVARDGRAFTLSPR